MKRSLIAALLIAGCGLVAPAQADMSSVPMESFEHIEVKHFADRKVTTEELQRAIIVASARLGWALVERKDDKLSLHLDVRRHALDIEIHTQPNEYSIKYVRSTNLGEAPPGTYDNYTSGRPEKNEGMLIHPSYNRWIKNLIRNTNAEIQALK